MKSWTMTQAEFKALNAVVSFCETLPKISAVTPRQIKAARKALDNIPLQREKSR